MAGRPTKFTEPVRAIILEKIEAGNYIQTAAAFAGVGMTTFSRWMERGRSKDPRFAEFRAFRGAVKRARAKAEADALESIQDAARDGTWQASAWYLERSFFRRWGRKTEIIPAKDVKAMTDAELEAAAQG